MPISSPKNYSQAALGLVAAAALMAACGEQDEETQAANDEQVAPSASLDLVVTASSEALPANLIALHALPNENEVYSGVIAGAPQNGGLTIFNVDGGVVADQDGPAYGSLAASSGFQLRGSALPLVAAVNLETGTPAFFAYSAVQGAILDVPVTGLESNMDIRAICTGDSNPSQLEFFALGADSQVERWRVRDTGAEALSAERQDSFPAPFEARKCVYNTNSGALYVASPLSELARIDSSGQTTARRDINAAGLGLVVLSGQGFLTAATGDSLRLLDQSTLETVKTLTFGPGLSVPGLVQPGAMDVSGVTYGGAYPDGFIVIADESDQLLKFIDRGYVERSLSEPENRFAPKPPRES